MISGISERQIYSATDVKVTKITFVLIILHTQYCTIQRYTVKDNLFALRVLSLMFIKSQQLSSQSPPSGLNISGKGPN